jgi:capsid assembly protease
MTMHANIASRAFNTPLLVDPAKASAFVSGLGPRVLGGSVSFAGMQPTGDKLPARAGVLVNDLAARIKTRGGAVYPVIDGVAVIEVTGTLVHRGAWIGESSGVTSYEGIASQIDAAASDPAVKGIALEIDSYGGEVAGAFDLADRIRATVKPVWAFVSEHAYSAGYIIASQANRIILPRTGGVGSIGVVVMHTDYSQALEGSGVNVTMIHSGLHKVDGNPYQPLPEEVEAGIQAEIDQLRGLFAETVAKGRKSKMTAEAALATEAQTYRGQEAVDLGLADEVSDVRAAFGRFADRVNGRSGGRNANNGGVQMAHDEGRDEAVMTKAEADAAVAAAVQAANEKAAADLQSAVAKALADERAAMAADKSRRDAIMSAPEAKGREKLAAVLAEKGMSADDAKEALSAAPVSYSAAMDQAGGAGVPADEPKEPAAPKGAASDKPQALVI